VVVLAAGKIGNLDFGEARRDGERGGKDFARSFTGKAWDEGTPVQPGSIFCDEHSLVGERRESSTVVHCTRIFFVHKKKKARMSLGRVFHHENSLRIVTKKEKTHGKICSLWNSRRSVSSPNPSFPYLFHPPPKISPEFVKELCAEHATLLIFPKNEIRSRE
jgi:hypothetical protein